MMESGFTSGVGLKEIVQQHGMTVGELARMFNATFVPAEAGTPVELEVVPVKGWARDDLFAATGLPWVPPSPNVPTPDTSLVYPGTGLFEGTNLSEGRGTTRPFEWIGAPYLDFRWADALNALDLPGVRFREAYFVPSFSKQEGPPAPACRCTSPGPDGSRRSVPRSRCWSRARTYDGFAWRVDADPRPYWVDKLSGSTRLRKMIDAGAGTDEVVAAWEDELDAFRRHRRPYLLYR